MYDRFQHLGAPAAVMAFALALGACSRSEPTSTQAVPPAPAMTQAPSATPSGDPAAASSPAPAADPSATANANDPPMQPMTKAEESAAMPMPGQANDHSTLASDPRKP